MWAFIPDFPFNSRDWRFPSGKEGWGSLIFGQNPGLGEGEGNLWGGPLGERTISRVIFRGIGQIFSPLSGPLNYFGTKGNPLSGPNRGGHYLTLSISEKKNFNRFYWDPKGITLARIWFNLRCRDLFILRKGLVRG